MEQKGSKMESGTAPELPKWVRGASGAPPDDENGVQKSKPEKMRKMPKKGGKREAASPHLGQKGLPKGGENHEKTRKKVTKNRNGLGTGPGGVFHDFGDEKRR